MSKPTIHRESRHVDVDGEDFQIGILWFDDGGFSLDYVEVDGARARERSNGAQPTKEDAYALGIKRAREMAAARR